MFSSDRFDDKNPQKSRKTHKIESCDFYVYFDESNSSIFFYFQINNFYYRINIKKTLHKRSFNRFE